MNTSFYVVYDKAPDAVAVTVREFAESFPASIVRAVDEHLHTGDQVHVILRSLPEESVVVTHVEDALHARLCTLAIEAGHTVVVALCAESQSEAADQLRKKSVAPAFGVVACLLSGDEAKLAVRLRVVDAQSDVSEFGKVYKASAAAVIAANTGRLSLHMRAESDEGQLAFVDPCGDPTLCDPTLFVLGPNGEDRPLVINYPDPGCGHWVAIGPTEKGMSFIP